MRPYRKRRRSRPDDLISASEIASYAFCPEAWRLEYGLGLPAENQAALDGRHAAPWQKASRRARRRRGAGAGPAARGAGGGGAAPVPGAFTMMALRLLPAVAAGALLLGLMLLLLGRGLRRRRGLGGGRTVALDNVTLTSRRYGLTGRVDRLVKTGGTIIPEEWKSARVLRPWHRAQMGVYFLVIEDQLGVRPPHGFIVTGDGTRHRVENDDALRAWVLELAGRIRAARESVAAPIPVTPKPGQCRPCGMRGQCSQARLD